MKIIKVEFENLSHFEKGRFQVDFFATDKVFPENNLYKITKSVSTQNTIGFTGLNATGKTTALRLLKIALNVVINNADLNSLGVTNMVQDETVMKVTFFHANIFYQLESVIGVHKTETAQKPQYYYKEEILRSKNKSEVISRAKLQEFNTVNLERSKLPQSEKKYLDEGKSIVGPIVKDNNCFVGDNLFFNYINVLSTFGTTPAPVINLFDESIEQLSMEGGEILKWKLKFKQEESTYHSGDLILLNLLVSTGTIRGQGLILTALNALKTGGYLILDELEMHLNKEIVRVILSLFKDRTTNPKGACLIFSTHYAEIFDFAVLNRKDNIYITRKVEGKLSAGKFSAEVPRNDFKKSAVILSNALTGTAPKYDAIKRLREFICKNL